MRYRSLAQCVRDLERHKMLVRVTEEVDPHLEMAEIQRRLYQNQGPAVLFERVKGSPFPALANLFGTIERSEFIFRSTLEAVRQVVALKADPTSFFKAPQQFLRAPLAAIHALPRRAYLRAPILHATTTLDQLPQITSWPMDGGPYVLLPQVCTEDPDRPGPMRTNVGMYRVQIAGNNYLPNEEVGIHYQIHRGIGVHHSKAAQKNQPLKVSIFVGGPPAHSFGAVMPLPEGLSELMFNGMFAGHAFRWTRRGGHFLSADADFVICGTIDPTATKPEGPFGDHLGYYSLQHEFPVMKVEAVYHRKGAIWPFTVVGRPPQEDTTFGHLIHEVTAAMVPVSVPGLVAMHAVDAAGVHPLLLAIGHERYVPYQERSPQELLTVANAVLGFGQASLAKYLLIAAQEDDPPSIDDIEAYLRHILERIRPERDLHFQTKTTMDTLDYSGEGLNQGSKVVIAAAGAPIRSLATSFPEGMRLPVGIRRPAIVMPGVWAIEGPAFTTHEESSGLLAELDQSLGEQAQSLKELPLCILCDDSDFTAASLHNFLWVTFTRSNPSHDLHGGGSFTSFKHWGCKGPIIIDARIKPHHAPPLVEDPAVTKRIDQLASAGGILHGIL